ncbi:small ribosomal subunit protein mS33 [Planococcus citri]|uniref:small ribosomal subunit protein mS33 n=1 Tax=Planococcus citri TaxID=170843 RepID=UPI0031F89581
MSQLYKYANLIRKNTPYAKKMRALSNRIFGEVIREDNNRDKKVVAMFSQEPIYKSDFYTKYYPRHPEIGRLMTLLREYGLYRDEHQDFKEEMTRLRALRGKVPWILRKGQKKDHHFLETKN